MKEKNKMDIWFIKNNHLIKATKWMIFKRTIYSWITRFKLVDSWKYRFIPSSDMKYYFKLSPKEYEDAEKIYNEKGTISYRFYPTGIGNEVKVEVVKSGEIIDITDVSSW